MSDIERLQDLIDQYWNIAWLEGDQGRRHDTKEGDAQECRSEIDEIMSELNELQANSAGAVPEGDAKKRTKPLSIRREKITNGVYKAVRQDGEVFLIQRGTVAKGWIISNERTFQVDSAVDLEHAEHTIRNCLGKVCAEVFHK